MYEIIDRISKWMSFATIFLGVIFYFSGSVKAATLKQDSVVSGTSITAGDLFDGIGDKASMVLGAAPRPGEDMVLKARTLLRVSKALDIPWRPSTGGEFVVVRSAATIISRDTIRESLKAELKEQGIEGDYTLLIPNSQAEIILPAGQPQTVHVETLALRNEGRFLEATLVAPSKENPLKRTRTSASIERLVEIPVLKTSRQKGDIIRESDIQRISIPENEMRRDFVVSLEDLIGMTPRRLVMAGEPVSINGIEAPRMVKRGEMITMTYNKGPLSLTTTGKALEHGSKGDVVRVINLASNQTLEGKVTGLKEVTIRAF